MSFIAEVLPLLIILVIFGAYELAGVFCKPGGLRVLITVAMCFGFLFVAAGIIFAGCAASMRNL